MGQQQLLLIVLGVIIVGIAVVVGLTMFQTSAVDANRSAVIADLTNLSAKASQYYKKPAALGGGAQDFNGFSLATAEQSNGNGLYRIGTVLPAVSVARGSVPAYAVIGAAAQLIYISGYGTEEGNTAGLLVMAFTTVTPTGITTTIIN